MGFRLSLSHRSYITSMVSTGACPSRADVGGSEKRTMTGEHFRKRLLIANDAKTRFTLARRVKNRCKVCPAAVFALMV
jgi:hypothetical protein